MNGNYPVIDTCFQVGVSPMFHFIAEEEMAEHLEKNGIDIQYIYQPDVCFYHKTPDWNPYLGNDYVAKIQGMFPEQVRGLATINFWLQKHIGCNCGAGDICPMGVDKNHNEAIEELDRAILDLGLWGLRVNPGQHNSPVNNRALSWPMFRRLVELQKQTGRKMIVSVNTYGDSFTQTPERVMETAKEFPELIFIMQHSGFVWGVTTLAHTAAQLENVYLDLSTMPQGGIVSGSVGFYGYKKLCVGTDGPIGDPRIKKAAVDDICTNDSQRALVYGGNLARALGLCD